MLRQILRRVADALRQVLEARRGGRERQRLVRVRVRDTHAGPGEEAGERGRAGHGGRARRAAALPVESGALICYLRTGN